MGEALVLASFFKAFGCSGFGRGEGVGVDGVARIEGQLMLGEGRGCSSAISQQRCRKACMTSTLNLH
jgi:hypothetical protein